MGVIRQRTESQLGGLFGVFIGFYPVDRSKGVIGRGSWRVIFGGLDVESACVCAHFGVVEVEVTLGFHALARDVMYQRLNRLFLIIRHRFL